MFAFAGERKAVLFASGLMPEMHARYFRFFLEHWEELWENMSFRTGKPPPLENALAMYMSGIVIPTVSMDVDPEARQYDRDTMSFLAYGAIIAAGTHNRKQVACALYTIMVMPPSTS